MTRLLAIFLCMTSIAGELTLKFVPQVTFHETLWTTNRLWECHDLTDTSSWECVYYNYQTNDHKDIVFNYWLKDAPDTMFFFHQVNDEELGWVINTNSASTNGIPLPPGY